MLRRGLLVVLAGVLTVADAHPHPCAVGATTRAFLQLVAQRGNEPRVLGPNMWTEHGIEPEHRVVGFCPWRLPKHHHHARPHVLEFECVDADSRTGCWQLYEKDEKDADVMAGCIYVPHRDKLSDPAE